MFSTINPATEQEIMKVPLAEEKDVDRAVSAARKAFDDGPWSKLSASDRAKFLYRIGEAILANADEIAYCETIDIGKPISESRNIDVPFVAELFFYYAGWATKYHGETIPVKGNYLNYTLREPLGVVGAITPWNFPFLLAAWKIAPALAMGNTVVHKPSEQSSLSAMKFAEICRKVELPAGRLQPCDRQRSRNRKSAGAASRASTRSHLRAAHRPESGSCRKPPKP